jgi:hypothetical protein
MAVTITQQEKNLLTLCAKGEAVKSNPYCSVNPSTVEPSLTSMTLNQVDQYQTRRIAQVNRSACGRYQFIQPTLRAAVKLSGLDPATTVFNPDVQDFLILTILRSSRKMESWKTGSLGADPYTNSANFQLQLAAEFASVPVPFPVPAGGFAKGVPKSAVGKGQSLYSGIAGNAAYGEADTFLASLIDIQAGGDGVVTEIDIAKAASNAPEGNSAVSQAGIAAGGGQGLRGVNHYEAPIPNGTLPDQGEVYLYGQIDPLDNRYDFRTGKKVRDLLINGTNPVANAGTTTNSGLSPSDGIGNQPYSNAQAEALQKSREATDGGITTTTEVIRTPAGPQTVVKQYKTVNTPAGFQQVEVKPTLPSGNISTPVTGGRGVVQPDQKYISALSSVPKFGENERANFTSGLNRQLQQITEQVRGGRQGPINPQDITAPLVKTTPKVETRFIPPATGK